MPQRWQREIEKLRVLDAPLSARTKIEAGPHGDGMPPGPPRGQRFVAGTVAFAVFLLALAFTARAFGSHPATPVGVPDPSTVVFSFTVVGTGSGTPTGTMTIDGMTVEGSGSTYSWTFDGGSMVADTFGQEFLFKTWTDVPAGARIQVTGSARRLEGWVDAGNDDGGKDDLRPPRHMYELDVNNAAMPSDAGRYVIEFTATWAQGARTFYFPIQVVEAVGTAPSASAPDAGGTPPTPTETPAATVAVPDLVGLGDQDAFRKLMDEDLKIEALFRDVPGDVWHVVSSDPVAGTEVPAGSTITITVVSRVTPLPEGALDELSCSAGQRVAFGSPHVMVTPAGEPWITGNTGGILRSDRVEPVDPTASDGLWHVIRDGAVIALIDYATLDGVACAGSGIAGA